MDAANSLDKYGDDYIFSNILKWGLYFGAIFQLACIMMSVFHAKEVEEDSKVNGNESQPIINRRLHKLRKQEKKKRR